MNETITKPKTTVANADTPRLLKHYQKTTRPEMRAAIAKELQKRGVKLPKKYNEKYTLGVVILVCVAIIGIGWYYVNNIDPRRDFAPQTIPVAADQRPSSPPLQAVQENASEVEQLQNRLTKLETANQTSSEFMKKLNDRLWFLGLISQENFARLQNGERDMMMMQRDWTPEQSDYIRRLRNSTQVRTQVEERVAQKQEAVKESEIDSKYKDLVGHLIQVQFSKDGKAELLWVFVESVEGDTFVGKINEDPKVVNLKKGDEVKVGSHEIKSIRP